MSSMNCAKLLLAADSVTTIIILAIRGATRPYIMQSIPASLQRRSISSANATSGVTTAVDLASENIAGIINDTLLPAPVGWITNSGLTPLATASTACSCSWDLNLPVGPYNCCNADCILSFVDTIDRKSV